MTNSKFIRSMTDKDLARFIGGVAECCACPMLGNCDGGSDCVKKLVEFLGSKVDTRVIESCLMPDPEVGA